VAKINNNKHMKRMKIPRQVITLSLISFFTDFASEMLYPVVPLFLMTSLGASMAVIGTIEGFAEVIAGLLKGYFGLLSDRLGKRSVFVRIGYGLSALVKPLPGFLPFVGTVAFSRTTDRIGKGIRTAPRDALLSAEADGNSGAIFGFHRGADTFGAVVGPLVALILLYFMPENYRLIFLVAIFPSVMAIFFTFKVKDPPSTPKVGKEKNYKEFWKTSPKKFKILLIFLALFSLVNSSDVFLILKSKSISGSDSTALLGYIFYNFIYATLSYPLGILSDKYGKKIVYAFGMLIFSLVYSGFALLENFVFIWILFALYGLFSASTEGVVKAWVSDIIDPKYIASGIGLTTLVMSFSVMLGSILAGVLWDAFGSQTPFLISAIVSALLAIALLIWKEK